MDDERWARARRVLCIRLDTIGDVLMTTPAIRACSGEGRHVTLLTSPAGSQIARLVPEIDDVMAVEAPWMKTDSPVPSRVLESLADTLRRQSFDAAVVFTVCTQSPLPAAMLAWLADIPLRMAHCRENPYHLLTDWVREPEPQQFLHEVRRQLDLVAQAGWHTDDERLSLAVPEAARREAAQALEEAGVDPARGWVLLHPGASAPSRRYPAEMYGEVVRQLTARGLDVVVSGSRRERRLADDVVSKHRGATSLAGRLDLPGMAALIEAAPVLVSNNTGPVHMAAALGTAVVDVYALTNLQHTPWQVPSRVLTHDVPCRNCLSSVCLEGHHACLRGIPPRAVVEATLELLDESRAGGGVRESRGSSALRVTQ